MKTFLSNEGKTNGISDKMFVIFKLYNRAAGE